MALLYTVHCQGPSYSIQRHHLAPRDTYKQSGDKANTDQFSPCVFWYTGGIHSERLTKKGLDKNHTASKLVTIVFVSALDYMMWYLPPMILLYAESLE